ncbi:MAG: glycosyltransferase family 2 protein [bacterium]
MGDKVFVVIPVYNGIEHTVSTVRSLISLLHPGCRVVVVDDGSTDGTSAILGSEFPDVTILRGDGNLWWSGAINLGARYALENGADYVLLLNNDVFLHPQFLEELLIGAREFPDSLIASKILFASEPWKIWCMGGKVNWRSGRCWVVGCGQLDDHRWMEPVEADWLAGMSVLVPVEVFRRGIWVDEKAFPQYCGDSDFSMRAKLAGFQLIVWPPSRVYNKVENSGLDTRLLQRIEPFSLRLFIATLTSIKSSKAFCTFGKWVLRHAPVYSWLPLFLRQYGFYFLKCVQVLLRLPSSKTTPRRNLSKEFEADYEIVKPLPRRLRKQLVKEREQCES